VLVSTGNTTNDALEQRLFAELDGLIQALSDSGFIELTSAGLVVHEG